ncbi:hypothetical protein [Roseomonas sp. BN140053]|uniref:hypothetical protein n=1 Tax=Roseomonas sp. BN140053 TaxID=3391898 RepID=UPI0039EC804E
MARTSILSPAQQKKAAVLETLFPLALTSSSGFAGATARRKLRAMGYDVQKRDGLWTLRPASSAPDRGPAQIIPFPGRAAAPVTASH